MRIETHQDVEIATARLVSRTPEALATFITSLAFDTGPIGEHVRTFLEGDDLPAITSSLKERIDALRGTRRSHPRHRIPEEVGERIGYILWSIEMLVLPVNSTTAFELLVLLIERDGDAMEQCRDDHWSVQMRLEDAAELVVKAMKSRPERDARQTLERLVAEDGYGTRQRLAAMLSKSSR